MSWTQWIGPALIGGVMLYAKSKASAAYRWYMGSEDTANQMPIALLLSKTNTGDVLPAPPAGYTWKPVTFIFASSPFTPPDQLVINVMQPVTTGTQAVSTPAAGVPAALAPQVSGFLTTQDMKKGVAGFLNKEDVAGRGTGSFLTRQEMAQRGALHGFLNAEDVAGRGLGYFLNTEELAQAPHLGLVLSRDEYLYAPATAPDFGSLAACCDRGMKGLGDALDVAVKALKDTLKATGRKVVPIPVDHATVNDFVVTADCKLHVVQGEHPGAPRSLSLREVYPNKGRLGLWRSDQHHPLQCAFGVRKV